MRSRASLIAVACLAAAVVVALFAWAFYSLPHELVQRGAGPTALSEKDLLRAQSDVRTAAIQALGGLAVILGAVLTARSALATIRQTREGQITDRFAAAIGHFACDDQVKKLGGIHELARVARQSKLDHWPAMEVLTAYLRSDHPADTSDETPMEDDAPPTIRAIAAVLRERDATREQPDLGQRLDLFKVDLRKARLEGADLEGANLAECDLRGAFLSRAKLSGACLEGADLRGAVVSGADFSGASLIGADAKGVAFDGKADLRGGKLADLDLRDNASLLDARYDGAISTAITDQTTQLRQV
jgi:Pentapeptide repeats (8 copies)